MGVYPLPLGKHIITMNKDGYYKLKRLFSIILLLFYICLISLSIGATVNAITAPGQIVVFDKIEKDWIKEHPVIRLAPDPYFPPIEFIDENNKFSGIAADYIALLSKKIGLRIELVYPDNYADAMRKFILNEFDIFACISKTVTRSEYMVFTTPYLKLPVVIIVRKNENRYTSLEDLKGKEVAVVSAYSVLDYIVNQYPEIKIDPVPDVSSGLKKVSFGLVDAFVGNLATISHNIEKETIANLKVAGETRYKYISGIAVHKDLPILKNIIEKGLSAISEEERQHIFDKWIRLERKTLFETKKFWYTIAGTLCFVFIIAVLVWNRSLKHQVDKRTSRLNEELKYRIAAENELKKLNDDIEQRIVKRTNDLESSNERLYQEIKVRRQAEFMLRIQKDMGIALSSLTNMNEALYKILDTALQTEGVDSGVIYIKNKETAAFKMAASKGLSFGFMDTFIAITENKNNSRLFLYDKPAYLSFSLLPPAIKKTFEMENLQFLGAIPIHFENEMIAYFGIASHTHEELPEITKNTIETIASHLGGIISRFRTQEELRENNKRQELALSGTGLGLWDWHIESDREIANDEWIKMLGYKPNEIIPMTDNWEKAIHPSDFKTVSGKLKAHLTGDTDLYEVDYRIKTAGGDWKWIRTRGKVFEWDEAGNPARMIGVHQDINEIRVKEDQLIQADKMASLGTLVSGMAHEINNPNNFIMINTPRLKKIWADILHIMDQHSKENGDFHIIGFPYSVMREKFLQTCDDIMEGSRRIDLIVNDLKKYSKRGDDTTFEIVRVNDVIKAALNMLNNQIKNATRRFLFHPTEVPNIYANSQYIEQIVINLIQNSCHSLRSPNEAIDVKTYVLNEKADSDDEVRVVIEVRDEGIGITQENITRIFDPFFTTKRGQGGTGLGLSVCNRLIHLMGGEIEFDSVYGKGSTAKVILPAKTSVPSHPKQSTA